MVIGVRCTIRTLSEIRKKAQETITARKTQHRESSDLLTAMLSVKDEQTGEAIPDDIIIDECVTFLFAGQDTTGSIKLFKC
jgi:cytochrome P450